MKLNNSKRKGKENQTTTTKYKYIRCKSKSHQQSNTRIVHAQRSKIYNHNHNMQVQQLPPQIHYSICGKIKVLWHFSSWLCYTGLANWEIVKVRGHKSRQLLCLSLELSLPHSSVFIFLFIFFFEKRIALYGRVGWDTPTLIKWCF